MVELPHGELPEEALVKPIPASEPYYDLGTQQPSFKVSTTSDDARIWFGRGFVFCYAFNHLEALVCFHQALAHDPKCAIACWGIAFASSPHYNKPWELYDGLDLKKTIAKMQEMSKKATDLAATQNISEIERDLINAIQHRVTPLYSMSVKTEQDPAVFRKCSVDFADAMQVIFEKHKNNLDILVLHADASMNLSAWELYDVYTGLPNPKSRAEEIRQLFEYAFATFEGAYTHAGLLHMYIHFVEMSANPENGVQAADALRNLAPDCGHLVHMPSHIDVLMGDYRRAIETNQKGILADAKWLQKNDKRNWYLFYSVHNRHFVIFAALFGGNYQTALDEAQRIESELTPDLFECKSPPLEDWLEALAGIRFHIYVRFGKWQEIIEASLPENQELYCVTTAYIWYAKGVAFAALGEISKAEEAQRLFRQACGKVPSSRMEFPNMCSATLAIAEKMLDGELEYRKGNFDDAFELLEKAIELEDGLIYSEPYSWLMPIRHALAALLLEQGHLERALSLYEADLGFNNLLPRVRQHPLNIWALSGYFDCLTKLERHNEARIVKSLLNGIQAAADVKVTSSCFCKRSL